MCRVHESKPEHYMESKIHYHISKAVSFNQTRSQLNPMQTGIVYAFLILLMYATCLWFHHPNIW